MIAALGLERELQNSLLRFSLGRESTLEEIEHLEQVLPRVIARAQRREQVRS